MNSEDKTISYSLLEFIGRIASSRVGHLQSNGHMPAGHNGPYNDEETPLRNTGHWLITFSNLAKLTGDKVFYESAVICANYLLRAEHRPNGYSFLHRRKIGKDQCNGLVGQAWTMEALAEASRLLEDQRYQDLAREVFFQHTFHEESGLWEILEIDGKNRGADPTFNHQLWFAAAASDLRCEEVYVRIDIFLDKIFSNMLLFRNGLVKHAVKYTSIVQTRTNRRSYRIRPEYYRQSLVEFLDARRDVLRPVHSSQLEKAVEYHSFVAYALGILKGNRPEHEVWKDSRLEDVVSYMLRPEYLEVLQRSKTYGFPYNAPGYEVAYSLSKLSNLTVDEIIEVATDWMSEQVRLHWDQEQQSFCRGVNDVETLIARSYELTRLPESILKNSRVYI